METNLSLIHPASGLHAWPSADAYTIVHPCPVCHVPAREPCLATGTLNPFHRERRILGRRRQQADWSRVPRHERKPGIRQDSLGDSFDTTDPAMWARPHGAF